MSEEEKGAIEYFDYQIELAKKEIGKHKEDEFKGNGTLEDVAKMQYCNLVKIKNLIEKLQKENAELKEENKKINKVADKMYEYISYYDWKDFESNTGCDRDDMVDYFYKE